MNYKYIDIFDNYSQL